MHKHLERAVALLAATALAAPVAAQAPVPMSKAEVQTLLIGKTTYWARADGSARWTTLTKDGWFWVTPATTRNAMKARYTIDDAGKMCHEWIEANLANACRVYARVGDKVLAFDPADLGKPTGVLERAD